MGTVTIYRTLFREEDVHDGDFPRDDTEERVLDDLTAVEALRAIREQGLTFEATGGSWASQPDGSHELFQVPFGRDDGAWREEISAHLSGWNPRVEVALINAVDAAR